MDHSHVNGETLRQRAKRPAPPKPSRSKVARDDEPGGALTTIAYILFALTLVAVMFIIFIGEPTGSGIMLTIGLLATGSICGLSGFCQKVLWKLERIRFAVEAPHDA